MQERSTNNSAVIDLAAYRKKKYTPGEKLPRWTPEQTERLIDEVSIYLLKAVQALQALPAP